MNTKLTDTQSAILEVAAGRLDGNIEPLPATLRRGVRAKVIEGLLSRGLVVDAVGERLLTDAGYAAVGKQRRVPKGVWKMDAPDALQKLEAKSRTIRPGTGWQAHTVRGAISGMIGRRLEYAVVTENGADRQRPTTSA